MTWEYRLIRMDLWSPTEAWHEVHEIYYENNKISTWTTEPTKLLGDTPQDIIWTMDKVREAMKRPILLESELPK